ncbi:hypothetical protein N788_09310 [Arenimonas donghaensis DSM 18148 = HO3-R19]|uniref:Uncharacterized protein n=2 Tax=Arenimonas TaxID=490567 RepID=A0A087ML22_9GAMM|nr:hypothetical protein N788_09310 [Arenimonas donghaensis DSM 18148 = HO3-R19]
MSYGDGEIVFFTGSPAQMRYSAAHADGRLRTLGGVSIEHIRQLIAKNGGA